MKKLCLLSALLVPFQLIAAKGAEECHQPAPQVALALAALQEALPAKSIFPAQAQIVGTALAGLPAQTQNAVDVGAEPHHHLVLANSAVRAFRVEVPAHQATLLHEHPRDYVFVALGDAEFTNAVAGKPETRVAMKDASLRFLRGGFAHVAKNESDTPFRNVTIELERPQGAVHNLCEKINEGEPLHCEAATGTDNRLQSFGIWFIPQFRTDATVVTFLRMDPMREVSVTASLEHLVVALQDTIVRIGLPGRRRKKLRPGEVMWLPRGTYTIGNEEKSPVRVLILEFKDSAAQP